MTQEEKAKAYDKVVNKLRHFIMQGVDPLITRADVQDFFPELKESEDERRDYQRWLDWIEKQAEQKSVLEELEMTLSVSEDGYLRSNIEKLIKELKKRNNNESD